MKNKIYTYAFISTPLLALLGVSPFYIFGILDLRQSIEMNVSILVSVMLYWAINGYIFLKLKKKLKWQTFILSYLLTFFSNILKAPFQTFINFRSIIEEYLIYPIITTITINTIILLIINLILGDEEKLKAQHTITDLTIQKLKAENLVLMQQLQPHFLFNALSILKSLIRENADMAEEYALKLSDFLRYGVEEHKNDLVSIKDEMQFVNNYIDLQQIRFEEAFTFELDIPDAVLQEQVPVFAIQALVENAFKHNYFTEKRPLNIRIGHEGEWLVIENNIVSLKVTERSGTGLINLKKRYEFIGGKEIEIHKSENSFIVKLPIIAK